MVENECGSNYIMNDDLKQNAYGPNDKEYNKILRTKKKSFLFWLLIDSLVKFSGATCELFILNKLRANCLNGLSKDDILEIICWSFLILLCINQDKLYLRNINDCKQQLSILKENKCKIKKIS